MMKKTVLLLIVLVTSSILFAQKKPKIQGNKEVVDVYKTLADFKEIEISDDLEVVLTQSLSNGYHLQTDANLVPIIEFQVENNVLKIFTLNRIVSSKKLSIDLTFVSVDKITISGDSKLTSANLLKFDDLDFTAKEKAEYKLDIEVNDAFFLFDNHTDGTLLIRGDKARMVLNENAFLKSDMQLKKLDIEINKRSDMNLEGNVESLKLTATGAADIKAKKLRSVFANLITSNNADVYIYASSELKLYAQGKSYIYVYGNPDIQVDGLNDKSQIIKK